MEKWQWRNRGHSRWQDLAGKPSEFWLQMEYRRLDAQGKELWRSPHVNGYSEKP